MSERSVTARFKIQGTLRQLSYLVPEGDNPQITDWIICSVSDATELDAVMERLAKGVIVEVHSPPHRRATKMYLALMKRSVIEERQCVNNAREAFFNAGVSDNDT